LPTPLPVVDELVSFKSTSGLLLINHNSFILSLSLSLSSRPLFNSLFHNLSSQFAYVKHFVRTLLTLRICTQTTSGRPIAPSPRPFGLTPPPSSPSSPSSSTLRSDFIVFTDLLDSPLPPSNAANYALSIIAHSITIFRVNLPRLFPLLISAFHSPFSRSTAYGFLLVISSFCHPFP
jgi:hypothetical protein